MEARARSEICRQLGNLEGRAKPWAVNDVELVGNCGRELDGDIFIDGRTDFAVPDKIGLEGLGDDGLPLPDEYFGPMPEGLEDGLLDPDGHLGPVSATA